MAAKQYRQIFDQPTKKNPYVIEHGNALRQNWREIIKPTEFSDILGNPPLPILGCGRKRIVKIKESVTVAGSAYGLSAADQVQGAIIPFSR